MNRSHILFSIFLSAMLMPAARLPALAQSGMRAGAETLDPLRPWLADTLKQAIPIGRQLFTDEVEKVLEAIDHRDGRGDGVIDYKDEARSRAFTQAFMLDARRLIVLIENLEIPHNEKVRYYKTLTDQLQDFRNRPWDTIAPAYFSRVFHNLGDVIIAKHEKRLHGLVRKHISLITLQNLLLLESNAVSLEAGVEVKAILYKGLAKAHPRLILKKIPQIRHEPYVDTIIADIATVRPRIILEAALENDLLAMVIKRNADPLVQTLVRLADHAPEPMALLPFLGPIHREERDMPTLALLRGNDDRYFQELIDLKLQKEPLCELEIQAAIRQRTTAYLRRMNAMKGADSRFSALAGLRDIDYYMLAVEGKDQLHSKVFADGLYPLLIRSMKKKSGLDLLKEVDFYRFRTFLRLCAEHQLLNAFLRTLNAQEKDRLFQAFTEELQSGELSELHRAVEVVNTFPYIRDPDFSLQLKSDAYMRYDEVQATQTDQTAKGILTYGIMRILLDHRADKGRQLAERLGLASVKRIPHEELLNSLNEIVEQVYFYPGKTGQAYYDAFMEAFRGHNSWEILHTETWTHIRSRGDKKISIYANKPRADSPDQRSLRSLQRYLDEHNLQPLIVFHCAPLPTLSRTISYLPATTRVLLAGHSFGDENLINAVKKNNKIHILSSRQSSTPAVDVTIFKEINKQLLYGRDLDWDNAWRDLRSHFSIHTPADTVQFTLFRKPANHTGLLFTKTYLQTLESWISDSGAAAAAASVNEQETLAERKKPK